MEIGSLNTAVQTPIKPVEVKTQANNNDDNSSNSKKQDISGQDVWDKMKNQPGYIPTVQEQTVIKAIEEANQKINGGPREFHFSIHEKTKEIMVKVVNSNTKEVIREIPSEKILDMVASRWEAAGLFVDEKR